MGCSDCGKLGAPYRFPTACQARRSSASGDGRATRRGLRGGSALPRSDRFFGRRRQRNRVLPRGASALALACTRIEFAHERGLVPDGWVASGPVTGRGGWWWRCLPGRPGGLGVRGRRSVGAGCAPGGSSPGRPAAPAPACVRDRWPAPGRSGSVGGRRAPRRRGPIGHARRGRPARRWWGRPAASARRAARPGESDEQRSRAAPVRQVGPEGHADPISEQGEKHRAEQCSSTSQQPQRSSDGHRLFASAERDAQGAEAGNEGYEEDGEGNHARGCRG
jgi:hypothetical protein